MKDVFPYYTIGHFINQPESRTEFEITRFEEMVEPEVEDPHKHHFYEIIWVEEGETVQVIDYKEYALRPGSLFFISPGQVHHFEDWRPVVGGSILFTGDFFLFYSANKENLFELSFLDNFYANPCVQLDAATYAEVKQTIDAIYRERARADFSCKITHALLSILLSQVQRALDAQGAAGVSKGYVVLCKQFKQLIDRHFLENLGTGDYAGMLNITAHHLNHLTKQVTGRTASEAIRGRIMLEAKRLLTFSDSTVSEIAAYLGYYDSSYFAKAFKVEAGVAPLEFRRTISEKYRKA